MTDLCKKREIKKKKKKKTGLRRPSYKYCAKNREAKRKTKEKRKEIIYSNAEFVNRR